MSRPDVTQQNSNADATGPAIGEQYTLEDLQALGVEGTEQLEQILQKTLAAKINGEYVSFTVDTITCTDITNTDNISALND